MIKWIRPSGTEITTNDDEATIDYCVGLGWKPYKEDYAVRMEDIDASGNIFDPEIHWKNRAKDKDGNWKVKK